MKNSLTKKKVLIGIAAIAMIVILAIGATFAYMTDSEQKVNTFTVGDLDITLFEPEWDDTEDGKEMVPGYETEKDPTVKAIDGSSYMRITVEFVPTDDSVMTTAHVAKIMETICFGGEVGINSEKFTKDEDRSTDVKFYYNYNGIFEKNDEVTLFDTVKIPAGWNQNDLAVLGAYKLVIRAEAIQSFGFETAEEAFAALDSEIAEGTAQEDYKTVESGDNV